MAPFSGRDGVVPAADRAHLRDNEQHAQRHHEERHELEDRVDALVQVGDVLLVHLRLSGQRGGITVGADRGHLDERHAGDGRGTRIHGLALLFAHGA